MKVGTISLAALLFVANCSSAAFESKAYDEVSMLFESACMANIGNPSQSLRALERSGLKRNYASNEDDVNYYNPKTGVRYTAGTKVAEISSAGRNLGIIEYNYCSAASYDLNQSHFEKIQSEMTSKYISGRSTYKTARQPSNHRVTADKRIAGWKVSVVAGQPPTQPSGRKFSSIELQQTK